MPEGKQEKHGGEVTLCQNDSFLKKLPEIRCTLLPGDFLLVPAGWWHSVQSFANQSSLSSMITHWFFTSIQEAHRMKLKRETKGSFANKQRSMSKSDPYSIFNFDFLNQPTHTDL